MAIEIEVTADQWHPRGEAVATYRGKPLLIWQGIPGERASVRVIHEGQNQSVGYWVESDRPDPHRVWASCDKYVSCGGCPIMHLDADGQQKARRDLVSDALREVGLGQVELGEFHPSPDGFEGFRHVVKVGVGRSDRGRIRLGAWGRRDRNSLVPIPKCPVAAPILRRTMSALAHHVIDLDIPPYDPMDDSGVLRAAVLRASRTNGDVLVTLTAGRRVHKLRELADRLSEDVSQIAGIWLHLNTDEGNAIYYRDEDGNVGVMPLLGQGFIEEEIGGITYRVGPGDFFQTNPAMAEVLWARTMERLRLQKGTPVIDLYCGVGGLALQAAKITGWALGIEEVESAVLNARESARRQGLTAEFHAGRVAELLPDVVRRLGEGARPTMVVNPARRGLEDGVVEAVLAARPRRLAYVSCNPRAMARDLAALQGGGLEVGAVEMFDMFPNTPHVECLVTLEAPDADEAPTRRAPRRRVVRKK